MNQLRTGICEYVSGTGVGALAGVLVILILGKLTKVALVYKVNNEWQIPLHGDTYHHIMYTDIFIELGLAKNEARIYETLLREGESGVGHISTKSKVHRRNVYDSLNRLIEKGLVFEIIQRNENHYQAVDPKKLMEFIREKEQRLSTVMPQLEKMYEGTPHTEEVFIYRGQEGWKNYMRDMLRIGGTAYFIGAKGGWLDQRVKHFFPQFIKEAEKKKMQYYHLFDHEVQTDCHEILQYVGKNYKFLPPGYSAKSAIDIFGDQVNIISPMQIGGLEEEFSLTVVVNKHIAESFRTWFQFMWDFCPAVKR